ncbi:MULTISPECIES: hypothetical protein [Selenomonas]|jgi:hypothetical protein|uniref:Uncharacterized protein n=1 Tax=Selenomonas ruminis TaxID=2593411 RepID=A0A5D6VXV6_9FIRM|nr:MULTISPECIES: hypothetical protein [Selenomonas]MBR1694937.1 hypothetical protein [Selenomonas sp.]TYZ19264.1 hypothetical protein FZ040_13580 [Selenomonas sp. mPRGC5]
MDYMQNQTTVSTEQQPKKERRRKTPEEKLAEALAKKKKADAIAKKRNEEIAALREEILTSKWKQLLREAKAAGADEDIVISIIMKQKDAIISKAVEVTKARNSN